MDQGWTVVAILVTILVWWLLHTKTSGESIFSPPEIPNTASPEVHALRAARLCQLTRRGRAIMGVVRWRVNAPVSACPPVWNLNSASKRAAATMAQTLKVRERGASRASSAGMQAMCDVDTCLLHDYSHYRTPPPGKVLVTVILNEIRADSLAGF